MPKLLTAAAAVVLVVGGVVGIGQIQNDEPVPWPPVSTQVFEASDANRRVVETDRRAWSGSPRRRARTRWRSTPATWQPLEGGHVYQVWSIVGEEPISQGVLLGRPRRGAPMEMPASGTQVAITVEPAGGSELPTSEPIVRVDPLGLSDVTPPAASRRWLVSAGGQRAARLQHGLRGVVAAESADRSAASRTGAAQHARWRCRWRRPSAAPGLSSRARFGAHGQARSPWKMCPPGIARASSMSCGALASRHGLPLRSWASSDSIGSSRCSLSASRARPRRGRAGLRRRPRRAAPACARRSR